MTEKKANKGFNKSLNKKLIFIFTFTILLLITLISITFYFQTKKILVSSLGNKAFNIAKTSVKEVNIEEYSQFQSAEDMAKESYKNLGKTLNHIREISGAAYLYIMKKNSNNEYIYIIESSDYDSDNPTKLGEVEKNEYPGFSIVMGGEPYVDRSMTVDEYGALISAYYPIKDGNDAVIGFIGLDYAVNEAYDSLIKFEQTIIISTVLLCIIIIVLMSLITKKITGPIKNAAVISRKIANYDLDTYHINIKNKDEIGLLAHSINLMMDNLKDIVIKIRNNSKSLKEGSSNLNDMTNESTKSMEQITSSISEIAMGSENASSNINELNTIISSLSTTMRETADNTNQANQVYAKMKRSASKGQDAVANIIDKINLINESTEDTSQVIEELDHKIQNINDIIQVINTISEQTNLLALNANIEAARAGEAGRGFTVVAEEVRKLAEETKNYSKEITAMISSIISNTKNAVDSMSNVKLIVHEGITAANISNEVFESLLQKINETSLLINHISETSKQQSENTNEILTSINEVSSISEHTASTCQNSVATVEETLACIEEITALTESLNGVAHSLDTIVSKFDL